LVGKEFGIELLQGMCIIVGVVIAVPIGVIDRMVEMIVNGCGAKRTQRAVDMAIETRMAVHV